MATLFRITLFIAMVLSALNPLIARNPDLQRIEAFIAPEWAHYKRVKKGGTHQSGDLLGARAGLYRMRRYGLYGAIEGNYLEGMLKGRGPRSSHLYSRATSAFIEGRVGFTFQEKEGRHLSLTPFLGVGYFLDKNNFSSRSPIPLHTKIEYGYFAIGFLSTFNFSPCLDGAFLFSVKLPYDPRCRISQDPDHPPVRQKINERAHFRFEVPITYCFCSSSPLQLIVDPSWETRSYGSHPNYPFDFYKTRYSCYGISLGIDYRY